MTDADPRQTELLALLVAIGHNVREIDRRTKENMENSARVLELWRSGVRTDDSIRDFCVLNAGGKDDLDLYHRIREADWRIAKRPGQVAMTIRTHLRGNHPSCNSIATDRDILFYVLTGEPLVLPDIDQDSESVDRVLIPCSSWAKVGGRVAEGDASRYMYLQMAFLRPPQTDSMAWEFIVGTDEVSKRINSDDFFVSDDCIPLVRPDDYLRATTAIGWVEGRPMPEVVKKYFDTWVSGLHVRYTGAVAVGQERAFFSNARLEARLFGFDPEEFLVDLTGNAVPKD